MLRMIQSNNTNNELEQFIPANFALRSLTLAVIGIACLFAVYAHVMSETEVSTLVALCMVTYPIIFLFYVIYLLTGYIRKEYANYPEINTHVSHLVIPALLYVNCLVFFFCAVAEGADPLVCYIPLILTSGTLAILSLKHSIALILFSNSILLVFNSAEINHYLAVYFVGGQFVVMLLFQSLIHEVRNRTLLEFKLAEASATQSLLRNIAERETKIEVARNLHDEVGHLITLIIVNLNRSIRSYQDKTEVPSLLTETHSLAKQLMVEIRRVVFQLRNDNSINLAEALNQLTLAISKPKIQLKIEGFDGVCSASTGEVIFRACQEAITNTIKHSAANNIQIIISKTAEHYQLEISDDGAEQKSWQIGQGLLGLKERVEDLMGEVCIESSDSGFKLSVQIPS